MFINFISDMFVHIYIYRYVHTSKQWFSIMAFTEVGVKQSLVLCDHKNGLNINFKIKLNKRLRCQTKNCNIKMYNSTKRKRYRL